MMISERLKIMKKLLQWNVSLAKSRPESASLVILRLIRWGYVQIASAKTFFCEELTLIIALSADIFFRIASVS